MANKKRNKAGTGKAAPQRPAQHKKTTSLLAAVEEYALHAEKPFSVVDVVDAVAPQIAPRADLAADIRTLLQGSLQTFHDSERDLYVPQANYFHHAQFRVLPTDFELERGILIPGHRFVPFMNPLVFPALAAVSCNGKKIKTKTVQIPFAEAIKYGQMFGWNGSVNYLVADKPANESVLQKIDNTKSFATASVRVKVFDMATFYTGHNFQQGDYLLLKVEDWKDCQYSCVHCPASQLDKNMLQSHRQQLETALAKSVTMLGSLASACEQLAYAFFLGGKELLAAPGYNLPDFLAYSQRLFLHDILRDATFWPGKEKPPAAKLWEAHRVAEEAWNEEPICDLMEELQMALSGMETEAFIKECLHQGITDPQQIFRHIWPQEFSQLLEQNAKTKKFDKLFADVCSRLAKQYQPASYTRVAPYRKQILDALTSNLLWFIRFDVMLLMAETFCQDLLFEMQQVRSKLQVMVIAFNSGDDVITGMETDIARNIELLVRKLQLLQEDVSLRLNGTDTVKLSKVVKKAARDIALEQGIEEMMESQSPGGKKSKKPGKNKDKAKPQGDPDTVYRLRIELLDMPIPIWRTVEVTGDETLADLHAIIQIAMGWEDCHMHSFHIDGVEYGGEPEDDMFGGFGGFAEDESLDESEYKVGQVIEAKGMRFMYEYDFGDSWQHEITVEAIGTREAGKNYPLCLDGKGACPPDDCGGAPGFARLLKIMKNRKHREYNEMLDWLGGEPFDPNAFDIDDVNEQLQN